MATTSSNDENPPPANEHEDEATWAMTALPCSGDQGEHEMLGTSSLTDGQTNSHAEPSNPRPDYLARVRSLAEQIRPGLFNKHFQDHLLDRDCKAIIVYDSDISDIFSWPSSKASIPQNFNQMPRDTTVSEALQNALTRRRCKTYVLLVQDINEGALQELGAIVNLDPCFVAQHLGHRDDIDSPSCDADLVELRRKFLPADTDSRRSYHLEGYQHYAAREGRDEEQKDEISKIIADWPHAGTDRTKKKYGGTSVYLRPRISWCQIAGHGCLVLVDGPLPSVPYWDDDGPFSTYSCLHLHPIVLPLKMELEYPGVNISFGKRYDLFWLLFGVLSAQGPAEGHARSLLTHLPSADDHHLWQYASPCLLPHLMCLTTWESNIQCFEARLRRLSQDALIHPNLDSFGPLARLRRNLADLNNALLHARRLVTSSNCESFVFIQEKIDPLRGQHATLDSLYDALLARGQSLSTALDREMQLVVSTVTVRDYDIMKRQARRATLLTFLAAIYLPLTLVTGIFGMNIKEINDGAPRFWACIVGIVVIGGATAGGIFGYRAWRDRSERKKDFEKKLEDKMYKLA